LAKSGLTKGLVAGRSSGLIGNGMTVNPAIDNTVSGKRAKKLLAIHASQGSRAERPKSGPAQPTNRASGRRESGGAKIRGGTI
jgi:hypothetical protein